LTKSKFKDVVVGLGEIGNPLLKLLSKKLVTIGYDINPKLIDRKNFNKYLKLETQFLHICIPFTSKFISHIIYNFKKFNPKAIIIHSTIKPHTTDNLQKKLPIPIIYSATRGVHKRMLFDLKRYTKFFAVDPKTEKSQWASLAYSKQMKKFGIKTKKMSNPLTLELAKIICDTSYYGWLITYAQISKTIVKEYFDINEINYKEVFSVKGNILSKLVNLIYTLDYSSIYHSVLTKTDPSPVKSIDFIKSKL